MAEIFKDVASQFDFRILDMDIGQNYAHLVVDCDPEIYNITDCVNRLKKISAGKLKVEFPHLKTTVPCFWTRAALVSTVGVMSSDDVRKYIDDQKSK